MYPYKSKSYTKASSGRMKRLHNWENRLYFFLYDDTHTYMTSTEGETFSFLFPASRLNDR